MENKGSDADDKDSDRSDGDVEMAEFDLEAPDRFRAIEYRVFEINGIEFDERDLALLRALLRDKTEIIDFLDPTQDQLERLQEAEIIESPAQVSPTTAWTRQGKGVLRSLQSAMMKKPESKSSAITYLLVALVFVLGLTAALLLPTIL